MTSAQDFLTEFAKTLIAADPLKRQELTSEYAKKLEAREGEIGRQFYDRFTTAIKEAQYCVKPPEEIPPQYLVVTASVFEAAREAAGIE